MRILALIMALMLLACQETAQPRIFEGADVDAIRAADADLSAAIERRDQEAALEHYEPSAFIVEWLRADERSIGAVGSYDQLLGDPNSALAYQYSDVEVSRSRDLAVSDGECSITRTNPTTSQPQSYAGYCMKSWRRREDGVWRIAREMRAPIHNRD